MGRLVRQWRAPHRYGMAAVGQLVTVFVDVNQLPGQLEMNDERQPVRQLPHGEFAASPQAFDAAAEEVLQGQPGRGAEELRFMNGDALDGASDQRWREVADERLDFGQLRHSSGQ